MQGHRYKLVSNKEPGFGRRTKSEQAGRAATQNRRPHEVDPGEEPKHRQLAVRAVRTEANAKENLFRGLESFICQSVFQ